MVELISYFHLFSTNSSNQSFQPQIQPNGSPCMGFVSWWKPLERVAVLMKMEPTTQSGKKIFYIKKNSTVIFS